MNIGEVLPLVGVMHVLLFELIMLQQDDHLPWTKPRRCIGCPPLGLTAIQTVSVNVEPQ